LVFLTVSEQTALKYIRFNTGNLSRPTWVHIASGKPFELKPGRFGRWSSTVCGKEYERDDYTTVKDEEEQTRFLCKRCARQKRIEHNRLTDFWTQPPDEQAKLALQYGEPPVALSGEEKQEMEGCGA
jgi:hypothetical protein